MSPTYINTYSIYIHAYLPNLYDKYSCFFKQKLYIHTYIHTLQDLSSVEMAVAVGSGLGFYSKLEESGWLRHLQLLLLASVSVAEKMHFEASAVLVHCSDGWCVCTVGERENSLYMYVFVCMYLYVVGNLLVTLISKIR